MNWAVKRQLFYVVLLLVVLGLALLPFFISLVPEPTCFDGKQNQGERGVDCSGPCSKICRDEAVAPVVLWARPFQVADGVSSAVAYITNTNPSFGARNVSYRMRLYDDENNVIAERFGRTDIPPKSSFPVFEGAIVTANSLAKRAFFEFTSDPVWEKVEGQGARIRVRDERLSVESAPKLFATLVNDSLIGATNIPVVAIVYDDAGTAIGASETLIDKLGRNESTEVVFTWPNGFVSGAGRTEVRPIERF